MAAGLNHLIRWVKEGTPIPSAPPIEVQSFGPPTVLARDSFGIALGGIRLSQVEVPIAVSVGTNSGPGTCSRWGYTIPFMMLHSAASIAIMASMYPQFPRLRQRTNRRDISFNRTRNKRSWMRLSLLLAKRNSDLSKTPVKVRRAGLLLALPFFMYISIDTFQLYRPSRHGDRPQDECPRHVYWRAPRAFFTRRLLRDSGGQGHGAAGGCPAGR